MKWIKKIFKNYNNPPSLFQVLEDDYQKKFPEGRDELWVSGKDYINILKRGGGMYVRYRYNGESVNKKLIKRSGHIIWVVGDVVNVSDKRKVSKEKSNIGNVHTISLTVSPKGNTFFGKLKLVSITNFDNYDILELIKHENPVYTIS